MDNMIIATKDGVELRTAIFSSYDIEIGDEDNTFEVTIKRQEYTEKVRSHQMVYIPGTEYGGLCRRWETDTAQGTISIGGITWRGMLQHKIIQPASGQDYATDYGELNTIIRRRISEAFDDTLNFLAVNPLKGSSASTGVWLPRTWQYERYCTLLGGLEKMLKSVGYRLDISFDQTERAAIVSAVPIVDYSRSIDFSSDMRVDYHVKQINDSVNHLVCLGEGELRNRTVAHLWMGDDGKVKPPELTQDDTSGYVDEIAEVYDYAGASYSDLVLSGIEHLKQVTELSKYEITISGGMDIGIGDIVGGRDYLSGFYLTAPVAGKVIRWEKGFRTIEYRISNAVTLEEVEDGGDDPDVPPALMSLNKTAAKEIVPEHINSYIKEDTEAEPVEEVEE